MKEKAFGVVYTLLTLFILGACSTEDVVTNNSDPKVSVSTTVKPLTKKEFSEVGTSGLTSSSKKIFTKYISSLLYAARITCRIFKLSYLTIKKLLITSKTISK